MANYIKNNSTQGLYLLKGVSAAGWVGANTPGDADLALLTLYTTYIYFDSVLRLTVSLSAAYESDIQRGFRVEPSGEGTQKWYTGGHDKHHITVHVETSRATAEGFENFFKYWNKTARQVAADELYLVRQYATTTFRQFANQTPALVQYIPIVLVETVTTEMGTTDRQDIQFSCIAVW